MKIISSNKKSKYNYDLISTYEVGIVLTGTEIKSVRKNGINLKDSFARLSGNNEIFLINSHIAPYIQANQFNHEETRERKLLLNKKELAKISKDLNLKGLTLVPVNAFLNSRGILKLTIAVGRGKKLHDKRMSEKIKSIDKDIVKSMKNQY